MKKKTVEFFIKKTYNLQKGLVAQWTRARGYEPRCRGFESLLAQMLKKVTETGIRYRGTV